ncbi:MAG: hypothetical protein ACR2G2_00220 [Pseudonocardia sp.]
MVGRSYTVTLEGRAVVVGEFARSLAEQERAERAHVAMLAERVARLGVPDARKEHQRQFTEYGAEQTIDFVRQLGLDATDSRVIRAAKRAASNLAESWFGIEISAGQRSAMAEPQPVSRGDTNEAP